MTTDKWDLCPDCGRPCKPSAIFVICTGLHCRNFSLDLFEDWSRNVQSKLDLWDDEESTLPQIDWAFIDKEAK